MQFGDFIFNRKVNVILKRETALENLIKWRTYFIEFTNNIYIFGNPKVCWIEIVYKLIIKRNFHFRQADSRLNHLPFMTSPLPMVILVSAYLYFVRNGKSFMEHRKPFKIERIIIAYNILQIIANTALFLIVSSSTYINFECDASIRSYVRSFVGSIRLYRVECV